MYLISLAILLIVIIYIAALGQPISAILNFFDIPSLMIIVLITLPMLFSSGLFKDLKRAFAVIMKKNVPYTKLELERSLEAVRLTIKLILFSGAFGFLIGAITILAHLNVAVLGPNMAVNTIPVLYALFGCFILLPIQSRLKVLILSAASEQ